MKGRRGPRRGAHGASSGGIPPATRLESAAAGITFHTSASRGCTRRQPRGPVRRRSSLQPRSVQRFRAHQRLRSRTKGSRAKLFRRHQEKPRCKKAERRSQDPSRPLSPLLKSRRSAPTHPCKHRNVSRCKKRRKRLAPQLLTRQRNPLSLSPRWREGASHPSCEWAREVTSRHCAMLPTGLKKLGAFSHLLSTTTTTTSSSQAWRQPSTDSGGREGKVNV
ncbi:hypothetical protein HPB51_027509 [Rhipicephalus microplus]|uniref:Uncharacterized protein n=1 Tax=Rhipicephalus microplus TaxID=6941 RepID=A0A9J6D068_RHIMP|nr:hypothetical protein HPB51_027509 [Rhipicephalus microplus]